LKKTGLILIHLFLVLSVFSQQYNFHNYSVKEGVAQSQVYSLLQDSRGYLWMGTRGGGISRFDGMNFKTYTVNDGLVNNYVFCIKEDDEHNLWIGTNDGISRYNGIEFITYQPKSDTAQVWIQDIAIDNKGRKWLATNSGVMFLDKQHQFINVTDLLKEKRTVVNAIHVDENENIWYGNGDGLYKITETNGSFSSRRYGKEEGFRSNSITSIKEDKTGVLWIATYGDGVYEYADKKFLRIDLHAELYKQTVLDIYFDNHDNVW
jgi:ligand-binding sensor domain-containing protein